MPVKSATPSRRELSRAERYGPFEPHKLYRKAEIHEPLNATPRQVHRWVYQYNLFPYIQMTGNGRRFRGRDLNRWLNDRLVRPEGW